MEDETVHSLHQLETSLKILRDSERFPSHHSQQTGKLNFFVVSFHQNQLLLAKIRQRSSYKQCQCCFEPCQLEQAQNFHVKKQVPLYD